MMLIPRCSATVILLTILSCACASQRVTSQSVTSHRGSKLDALWSTPAEWLSVAKGRRVPAAGSPCDSSPEDVQKALEYARKTGTREIKPIRDQLAQAYVYGLELMKSFDDQVNTGAVDKAFASPEYAKLQLLHAFEVETQHRYSEILSLLINGAYEQRKGTPGEKTRAQIADEVSEAVQEGIREAIAGNHDANEAIQKLATIEAFESVEDTLLYLVQCKAPDDEELSRKILERRLARRAEAVALQNMVKISKGMNHGWAPGNKADDVQNIIELRYKGLKTAFSPFGVDRQPAEVPAGTTVTGKGFASGVWALTFDDGPALTTPNVRDNLAAHGLKATFYVLAKQIEPNMYPAQVRKSVEAGHKVASHSYTHPQVNKLPQGDFENPQPGTRAWEIRQARVVLNGVLGDLQAPARHFRLPYGAGFAPKHQPTLDDLRREGLVNVFWNVDSLDWQDKNPESIFARTKAQIAKQGRGIILFHDIHPQSVIASEKVMGHLQAINAQMVMMPQALGQQ